MMLFISIDRIYPLPNGRHPKRNNNKFFNQFFFLFFLVLSLLSVIIVRLQSHSTKTIKSTLLSQENIGYKHPHSTFLSKITFWWLTPLLWRGYWEPLELQDLGNLHETDTSRAQYDRFLFIYRSFKVSI